MKIAIRGEGKTDMGYLDNGEFIKGPILILIEKLECYTKLYSALGCTEDYNSIEWYYIHKKEIKNSSNRRKKTILRGKKDTRKKGIDNTTLKGFYEDSEAFAYLAKEKKADIAIFFVDSDKDTFELRYEPIKKGLKNGGSFDVRGVPMIPVKISEVWLLCCLNDYKNCSKFEALTNDKNDDNYPKKLIKESGKSHKEIAQNCDSNKINMPSFNQFRKDFHMAINNYMGYKVC